MQLSIYKMINNQDEHYFNQQLTNTRTIRTNKQNKVRHYNQQMGNSTSIQKSYLYRANNLYNKLPRNLTLIKNQGLFKKWLKKYNLDNRIKLKEQIDNEKIDDNDVDDPEEEECYYESDENDDNNEGN